MNFKLKQSLSKVATIALVAGSVLTLASCGKINELVTPLKDDKAATQPEQTAPATPETTTEQPSSDLAQLIAEVNNSAENTDLNAFRSLSDADRLEALLNPNAHVVSFSKLANAQKDLLERSSFYSKNPTAAQEIDGFYNNLQNLTTVPNKEVYIFYIDTFRHIHDRLSKGYKQVQYVNNVHADTPIRGLSDADRKAMLAGIADSLNKTAETFFASNQFLDIVDFKLTTEQFTAEYDRYSTYLDAIKGINHALIAEDNTCSTSYDTAGDMLNCLDFKYYLFFDAVDSQLISAYKSQLISANSGEPESDLYYVLNVKLDNARERLGEAGLYTEAGVQPAEGQQQPAAEQPAK